MEYRKKKKSSGISLCYIACLGVVHCIILRCKHYLIFIMKHQSSDPKFLFYTELILLLLTLEVFSYKL